MDNLDAEFETRAVQAGSRMRVGDTTSTVAPIAASTTFTYDTVDEIHAALAPGSSGYAYARNANPTVVAFEQAMCSLENAREVVAFGSGMAAVHAAIWGVGLKSGDVVVASSDLYGTTRGLLSELAAFGIGTRYVNVFSSADVERALGESGVQAFVFEGISNPLVRVPDVGRLADQARMSGAVSIIDNTFATPYLLRPLELGVDVVIHSVTKYLAGHGDVMAGVVASNNEGGHASRVRALRTLTGGVLSPFEAWLAMRGMRTLAVRMERHCSNALEVARWMDAQDWTERVYYPGLPDDPCHETAAAQFGGKFGAMLSLDLVGGRGRALAFIDHLQCINSGTSLGDVESLALYPRLASHRNLTEEELNVAGIGPGLVRISVGLESVGDLKRDLARAADLSVRSTSNEAGRVPTVAG